MHLSILIVEDEFIIAEDIRSALLANGYSIFGIARTYEEALDLLRNEKPDFVLVDITLNGEQSGLEIGRMLSEDMNVPYVYITSHSDVATLEKVKLTGPSGYLLKPFKRESIYTTIEVGLVNFNNRSTPQVESPSTTFKRGSERVKVRHSEILFLESDSNYTHVHTLTSKFTERKTLKELLDELADCNFIRVHKSYAVNRSKIHQFMRDKIIIAGQQIPVGRSYAEEIGKYLR